MHDFFALPTGIIPGLKKLRVRRTDITSLGQPVLFYLLILIVFPSSYLDRVAVLSANCQFVQLVLYFLFSQRSHRRE